MRTLRDLLIVSTLLLTPCAFAESQVREESRDVADFDGVVVEAPLKAHVTLGPQSVRLSGNANRLRQIRTEVADGKLVVWAPSAVSVDSLEEVQLTVSSPKLTSLESSGFASVDAKVSATDSFVVVASDTTSLLLSNLSTKRLVVDVSGRSVVKLAGTADTLVLNASDGAQVTGWKLELKVFTAHITTNAQVAVNPSDFVEAYLTGNSRLFVDSKPARCAVSPTDGALVILTCGVYSEPPARPRTGPSPREPDQDLESPATKHRCLEACAAGGETLEGFCRRLKISKRRALCWAATQGSKAACIGMCNALYK